MTITTLDATVGLTAQTSRLYVTHPPTLRLFLTEEDTVRLPRPDFTLLDLQLPPPGTPPPLPPVPPTYPRPSLLRRGRHARPDPVWALLLVGVGIGVLLGLALTLCWLWLATR